MKKFIYLLVVIVILAAAVLVVQQWRTAEIRNVLLVSIDTCRADHLGCYGYNLPTTPHIDALAQKSTVFSRAISPMPLTLPAHSSVMTGVRPLTHGVHDNLNQMFSQDNTTIAEIPYQGRLADRRGGQCRGAGS